MTLRVTPNQGPPLAVVAPFFAASPLALAAAGLGIAALGRESFVAVNSHHNVAITHAIVLGWLTLTMMGALYQLGPAVLGTATRSIRAARVQFWIHAAGVALFAPSLWQWNLLAMSVGGSLVVVSVLIFLWNTLHFGTWRDTRVPVIYVRAAQAGLLLTVIVGITFVGNHQHAWFAVTPGRLAAHAHLGLVGWIGVTLMGISYQLVPMFNVVRGATPRLARPALTITLLGLVVFAVAMLDDPSRLARLALAAPITAGFLLWGIDQVRLMRARARRKLDIQGRAAIVSLGFLALTVGLAMGAAWGTPFGTQSEPARWPLAYGLCGALGWAGTAVIGNTHKVLPFLVWFHRYRAQMGDASVPLMTDLYSDSFATFILSAHSAATLLLVGSALAGEFTLFRAGGVVLLLSAVMQALSIGWTLAPRRATRSTQSPVHGAR